MKKAEKDKLDDAIKDIRKLHQSLKERQERHQRVSKALVWEAAKVATKLEQVSG